MISCNHHLWNTILYYMCHIKCSSHNSIQFSSCKVNILPDEQQHLCTFRQQLVASIGVYRSPAAARLVQRWPAHSGNFVRLQLPAGIDLHCLATMLLATQTVVYLATFVFGI